MTTERLREFAKKLTIQPGPLTAMLLRFDVDEVGLSIHLHWQWAGITGDARINLDNEIFEAQDEFWWRKIVFNEVVAWFTNMISKDLRYDGARIR